MKAWTDEEIRALHAMFRRGVSDEAIATVFNRSRPSVRAMRKRLGALRKGKGSPSKPGSDNPTTQRDCMTCGRPFMSEGPHHRLCVEHRTASANPFEDMYEVRA